MDERITRGLRRKLMALRQQVKDQLADSEAGMMDGPQSQWARELSAYDNHPADSATETYQREQEIGLIDHRKRVLSMIDSVIAKIGEGTYGLCERCRKPISAERLQAIPFALLCKECREMAEQQNVTHLRAPEESLIRDLFADLFSDDTEFVGTTGEDAWQDVAQYGTSESYQDVATTTGRSRPDAAFIDSDETVGAVEGTDRILDEEPHDIEEADY